MRFSTRVKLVCILAAFGVMLAGSAWAAVVDDINAINGLTATDNNGAITVTGSAALATGLNLDITGLTIDWQANLNGPSTADGGYTLVNVYGNGGLLKITGGTMTIPDHNGTNPTKLVNGFSAGNGASIEMSGGTIQSNSSYARGVDLTGAGSLTFTGGGTIDLPYGIALYAAKGSELVVSDHLKNNINEMEVYGWILENVDEATSPPQSGKATLVRKSIIRRGVFWWDVLLSNFDIDIKRGAIVEFEDGGNFTIKKTCTNAGAINIYGTVINSGKFTNASQGIINNYSSNTLDNKGTLTNNGTINNASAGRITNSGAIVNEGKIANEGTVDNSGTIKSDPANFTGNAPTGNPVQPLTSTNPDAGKSGGGGCSAGLGMVGLLFAGWAALKNRRA